MGFVWGGMMLTAVLFGLAFGESASVAEAALSGAKSAVNLSLDLLGTMCLWSGLLEVARRAGLTEKLATLLRPFTKRLFPRLAPNSAALSAILMNMTANLLGLGNAATPLGLAAMAELQKENPKKERATDEMCTFVVINTASITLIPMTVIALRQGAGSSNPFEILFPVWICSLSALFVGLLVTKLLAKRERGRL